MFHFTGCLKIILYLKLVGFKNTSFLLQVNTFHFVSMNFFFQEQTTQGLLRSFYCLFLYEREKKGVKKSSRCKNFKSN